MFQMLVGSVYPRHIVFVGGPSFLPPLCVCSELSSELKLQDHIYLVIMTQNVLHSTHSYSNCTSERRGPVNRALVFSVILLQALEKTKALFIFLTRMEV